MAICGFFLHQGFTKGLKTLEQNLSFKSTRSQRTLYVLPRSHQQRFQPPVYKPHTGNPQSPGFDPSSLWRMARARNVSLSIFPPWVNLPLSNQLIKPKLCNTLTLSLPLNGLKSKMHSELSLRLHLSYEMIIIFSWVERSSGPNRWNNGIVAIIFLLFFIFPS